MKALAGRYLVKELLRGAVVRDGAKAKWSPGFQTASRRFDPSAVWLLFLPEPPGENVALRSSTVVAVCKRTGRILYHGSANDEG